MVQKVFTWSNTLCSFHVSCLLIHLVFESEFATGVKDVTLPNEIVILINMKDSYVENGRSHSSPKYCC